MFFRSMKEKGWFGEVFEVRGDFVEIWFWVFKVILKGLSNWGVGIKKELNRVRCGLEFSRLGLIWEFWFLCGDCYGMIGWD